MAFSTSLVALMVFSASFLTSSATTAKPRPASPARAASMAAFKASRLVWSAMSEITLMMAPMPWASLPRAVMSWRRESALSRTRPMQATSSRTVEEPSVAWRRASGGRVRGQGGVFRHLQHHGASFH